MLFSLLERLSLMLGRTHFRIIIYYILPLLLAASLLSWRVLLDVIRNEIVLNYSLSLFN